MEDLADLLRSVGYPAALLENLELAIQEGSQNVSFTQIVSWLSYQLQGLCDLESFIHDIKDPEDHQAFLLEVSSFLRELSCPYSCLTEGSQIQRLAPLENRKLLISYLVSELQAAKITESRRLSQSKPMTVEVQESETAKELKQMLIALNFSRPPSSITPMQLFSRVEKKLSDMINKGNVAGSLDPLFTGTLTDKQWFQLEKLRNEMQEEYTARRNMLLTRLDVTIQSFSWSDRLKKVDDAIAVTYSARRKALSNEPSVRVSEVLAARKDLLMVEATSSASVRQNTKSSVNSVIIGEVPDRGGRPEEQQPPPPEVPSWQKNEPNRSGPGFQKPGPGGDRAGRGDSSFRNREQSGRSESGYGQGGSQNYRSGRYQGGGGDHNNYSASGGHGRNRHDQNQRPQPVYNQMDVRHPAPVSDYRSGDYHMVDPFQPTVIPGVSYVPAPSVYQHYVPPAFAGGGDGDGFGVGIGGYGATGGNFQQFGVSINQGMNDRGGYRGGRSGRNPRGGRGGRYQRSR